MRHNHTNQADAHWKKGLGDYYQKQKKLDKAISAYTKSIALSPYWKTYNNRGGAYTKLKELNLALEDFNQAIELHTKCVVLFNNRGIVYKKLRKFDEAIKDFNQAIKLDPRNAVALKNLKQLSGSVAHFTVFSQVNPISYLNTKNDTFTDDTFDFMINDKDDEVTIKRPGVF